MPIRITVEVDEVRTRGNVMVLSGTTVDGSPVLVESDARTVAEVIVRLAAGEGPVPVEIEPWQLLAGGASA